MADPDDAPGYADAMAELDAILAELERADLDVDRLTALVSRASELVRSCRARIATARIDVQAVVEGLVPTGREGDVDEVGDQ